MTSKKNITFEVPDFSRFVQIPDLTHLVAAFRPPPELFEQIRNLRTSWEAALEPLREPLKAWSLEAKRCEVFEKAGWLPHWSTPFHLIDDDAETFDQRVHDHYLNIWPELRNQLHGSVCETINDNEAIDCYREALDAHGYGLYRASTRMLFPEIERISRHTFHAGDTSKQIAGQHDLIKAVGELSPGDMKSRGMPGFRLFMALARHTYEHSKSVDEVAKFASSEIPNRHAALHGVRPYTSLKSSINSLLFFEFIVDVIDVIITEREPA